MSLFVVLVDTNFKRIPGAEPVLPKIVAHNLTREAAERVQAKLSNDSVEGQPTGWMPYLWEYVEPHADVADPGDCVECQEIVSQHCKHLLHLLRQELEKRSPND